MPIGAPGNPRKATSERRRTIVRHFEPNVFRRHQTRYSEFVARDEVHIERRDDESTANQGGRHRRRAHVNGVSRSCPIAPVAGLDGAWSGNGTISLSDGSSERIRCRASYKVDGTGLGLKQTLRCASDSYKFDLSSEVRSQGEQISGNWTEASRNIVGNLQGTAGGGKVDVVVEAPGFTASLLMRTNGNRQSVQINSKGDIRSVTITMVKS